MSRRTCCAAFDAEGPPCPDFDPAPHDEAKCFACDHYKECHAPAVRDAMWAIARAEAAV